MSLLTNTNGIITRLMQQAAQPTTGNTARWNEVVAVLKEAGQTIGRLTPRQDELNALVAAVDAADLIDVLNPTHADILRSFVRRVVDLE